MNPVIVLIVAAVISGVMMAVRDTLRRRHNEKVEEELKNTPHISISALDMLKGNYPSLEELEQIKQETIVNNQKKK